MLYQRLAVRGVLIALLHALKCEHKVVDPRSYQLSRRQLRKRAAGVTVVMGAAAGAAVGFSR